MNERPWPVTPAQYARDRFGYGTILTDAEIPELVRGLENVQGFNAAVAAGETTRKSNRPSPHDESDSGDREVIAERQFMYQVGRAPADWELAGPPAPGCHACARDVSACDAHRREIGSPIPLPPHPWPRDGGPDESHRAPYDMLRSVADTADGDWPAGR